MILKRIRRNMKRQLYCRSVLWSNLKNLVVLVDNICHTAATCFLNSLLPSAAATAARRR